MNLIRGSKIGILLNLKNFRAYTVVLVYIVIIGIFMITAPRTFLSYRIYMAFLSTVPFSLIMALGLTFVIIAGEIDLSFTGVMVFSGFIFSYLYITTGNTILALVASLISGAIIGILNSIIIAKIGVPSIITTLGTQFIWAGLALVLSKGKTLSISDIRQTVFYEAFVGRIGGVLPTQALWAFGVAIILGFILNMHKFGEHVMFLGDNREAARMMGVNVNKTIIQVFTLIGILGAFSSVLLSLEMTGWWPTQGPGYLLITIAAVFIGGTSIYGGEGTIFGTVVGAFIVGSITAGIVASGVEGFWIRLVVGLVLITAVILNTFIARRRS
jgi:simple sugar transport system permease protein